MVVDPAGASLASIALIFPIYDACNRIYNSWQVRASFGKDMGRLSWKLHVQWVHLYQLMDRRQRLLLNPPDPDDRHHVVTSTIMGQLAVIKDYFGECDALVIKNCGNGPPLTGDGGYNVPETPSLVGDGGSEIVTTPTRSKLATEVTSINSDGPSQEPTSQKMLERVRVLLHIGKKRKANIKAFSDGGSSLTSSGSKLPKPHDRLFVLPIPELEHAYQSQVRSVQTAQNLQQSSTFIRRNIWDHHDKEKLERLVAALKEAIEELESIIPEKTPVDPAAVLTLPATGTPKKWKHTAVQKALQRAHESLRKLNHSSGVNGSKAMNSFSVYITEPPEKNREMLSEDTSLPLRASSLVFCIQMAHTSHSGSGESDLLFMETTMEVPPNPTITASRDIVELLSLDGPETGIPVGEDELYDIWGWISPPTNSTDWHQVFHDKTKWKQTHNLSELITNESFKDSITIELIIKLARRIIQAHLDFAYVQSGRTETTLDNFQLYSPIDGNNHSPEFGRLYLSNGFGTSPPRRRLGATDGTMEDPNTAMNRLGLNLYELGSHKKIDPTSVIKDQGTISAQNEAKMNMRRVESNYGLPFAQIVLICLEYKRPSREDAEHEFLTVEKLLDALQGFENALNKPVI